jgi:putative tricarboxylic transport membrane protein
MIDTHHPGFLYFIYGILIIANFAYYLLAFVVIKPSVKLFSMPREVLLPIITLLCVVGSFSQKIAMFDIYLMFGFGLLGFAMRKTGFPIAPMVLGVILGDMLDANLRRSMEIFRGMTVGQILSRPIGTTLIIIVLITFVGSLYRKKEKTKEVN